jgi:hypothetical protein
MQEENSLKTAQKGIYLFTCNSDNADLGLKKEKLKESLPLSFLICCGTFCSLPHVQPMFYSPAWLGHLAQPYIKDKAIKI